MTFRGGVFEVVLGLSSWFPARAGTVPSAAKLLSVVRNSLRSIYAFS
jgi:hypothetical protein